MGHPGLLVGWRTQRRNAWTGCRIFYNRRMMKLDPQFRRPELKAETNYPTQAKRGLGWGTRVCLWFGARNAWNG
jgi:hypothetical protein